jgi:hypothetical protein
VLAVEFLPDAQEEMIAAAEWYEARRPDTGQRFLSEISRHLRWIAARPDAAGTRMRDRRGREVRAMFVGSFPYRIVYRIASTVLVVAVAHTRRRPGYWMRRLRNAP